MKTVNVNTWVVIAGYYCKTRLRVNNLILLKTLVTEALAMNNLEAEEPTIPEETQAIPPIKKENVEEELLLMGSFNTRHLKLKRFEQSYPTDLSPDPDFFEESNQYLVW